MAFARVLDESPRNAGKTEAASVTVARNLRARVRLLSASDEWATAGAILQFGFERSTDGGLTWEHWVSGNPPFSRDKGGNPPSVGCKNLDAKAVMVRPFVVYGKRATVGAEVEVA
ncbi:MAG: hypothetical protein ACREKH_01340 [Candidatus Rokuibacteriota bacterium]